VSAAARQSRKVDGGGAHKLAAAAAARRGRRKALPELTFINIHHRLALMKGLIFEDRNFTLEFVHFFKII